MSIYVSRRLPEDRRVPLTVALLIHLALFALLFTFKVAVDRPTEGGSPAIQLVSFPKPGDLRPRTTGGGGAGVEAEIPMPSAEIASSGPSEIVAPPLPEIPVTELSDAPLDTGGSFSLSREAELRFPTLTSSPPYPLAMERQGIETDLRLRLDIDETGRVTGATPIGSHHRGFLSTTIEHIKARWKFRPKLVDGTPVPTRRTFLFEFRIEKCGEEFCRKVTGVAD